MHCDCTAKCHMQRCCPSPAAFLAEITKSPQGATITHLCTVYVLSAVPDCMTPFTSMYLHNLHQQTFHTKMCHFGRSSHPCPERFRNKVLTCGWTEMTARLMRQDTGMAIGPVSLSSGMLLSMSSFACTASLLLLLLLLLSRHPTH